MVSLHRNLLDNVAEVGCLDVIVVFPRVVIPYAVRASSMVFIVIAVPVCSVG